MSSWDLKLLKESSRIQPVHVCSWMSKSQMATGQHFEDSPRPQTSPKLHDGEVSFHPWCKELYCTGPLTTTAELFQCCYLVIKLVEDRHMKPIQNNKLKGCIFRCKATSRILGQTKTSLLRTQKKQHPLKHYVKWKKASAINTDWVRLREIPKLLH